MGSESTSQQRVGSRGQYRGKSADRLLPSSLQLLLVSSGILFAFAAAGIALVTSGATHSMSRYIFVNVDYAGLVAVCTAISICTGVCWLGAPDIRLEKSRVPYIAVAVLVASCLGVPYVYHSYAFSMDEWMTRFQASIFLQGTFTGYVPSEWREFERALFHDFTNYNPETGTIASSYRPGMAAITAGFEVFGLGVYASAFLTAGSVWLAGSNARVIWPGSPTAPAVAALLVASSSQALAAALTSYAMAGHLFFNLLWLRLFLQNSTRSHIAAAFCGVATASLHQVHTHVFFATPFFVLLLRPFRLGLLAWYGTIYAVGHFALLNWDAVIGPLSQHPGSADVGLERLYRTIKAIAHLPSADELATVSANLIRFISWQSLAIVPLMLLLARRRPWSPVLMLVAASVATTFLPYLFLMPDQGHGWGYRYLHGVIGNVALIATAGWVEAERRGATEIKSAVTICIVISLVILVPVRGVLMERTLAPWWRATQAVETIDADIVVIDSNGIYYGQDIPRMDPYVMRRPVLMRIDALSREQIQKLCREFRVATFGRSTAEELGLPSLTGSSSATASKYEEKVDESRSPACSKSATMGKAQDVK